MLCSRICMLSIFTFYNMDTQEPEAENNAAVPEQLKLDDEQPTPADEKKEERVFKNSKEWERLIDNLQMARQWLHEEESST